MDLFIRNLSNSFALMRFPFFLSRAKFTLKEKKTKPKFKAQTVFVSKNQNKPIFFSQCLQ